MSTITRAAVAALVLPAAVFAQGSFQPKPPSTGPIKIGPPKGTVIVVGGGGMGPEVYAEFIKAAGGPDALILDIPNSGGAATYDQNAGASQGFRRAGAKNVVVLHTRDRKVADSDSFVALIKEAGGIWFDGGRQWNLVNDYGGTKTEAEFNAVLARGGVIAGSSAGASILGDFMVRGAPSGANGIMDYVQEPKYEKGFAYLRNTGIDQHVVARERLPDFADSLMPRYPTLLGISEDEGTAWVVRGDTGRIIGRNKAFVYGGKDNDPGSPFLTLRPGDTYNLATRRVIRRAIEGSSLKADFVDGLFTKYQRPAAGGATVLVAMNGNVLVNRSYGIPNQPRYMPTTTVPAFALGGITEVFKSICEQMPVAQAGRGAAPDPDSVATTAATTTATTAAAATTGGRGGGGGGGGGRGGGCGGGTPASPLQSCVTRVSSPMGLQKTTASADQVQSSVDALYRLALGFEAPTTYRDVNYAKGWQTDTRNGVLRLSAYGTPEGKRAAFVRIPGQQATIIVLTNDETADAKGIADKISDMLSPGAKKD